MMSPREELLAELDHLATVEHALCVEYLFLDCALVDRGPGINLALGTMFQLRRVNEALVMAGQSGNMSRAAQVRGIPPLAFAPLDASQLDGVLGRESAIAAAVDARYAIAGSLLSLVADLDPGLRDRIDGVVDSGAGHAAEFISFRESLAGRPPAEYLRPVREPADDSDTTLRSISQGGYRLIIQLLQEQFAGPGGLTMLALARDAMRTLDGILFLLAERNLLPLFD
jgi:hypothetical protein